MSRATVALAVVGVAILACGGGSGGGGSGSCNPIETQTITIKSSGTSPQSTCVTPQGRVTFVNSSGAAHDIRIAASSGTCPTSPGVIPDGQQVSVQFPAIATCTYSDATQSGNAAFTGTIGVDNQTVTGGGY